MHRNMLGQHIENFQLHRFTMSEYIAKVFLGGDTFLTHPAAFSVSLSWPRTPGNIITSLIAARIVANTNSSGDEIANVNFLYDYIVDVLQNTIDSCINSATYTLGYVLKRMFTKFSEITQYNGHYAVQGHLRSPILVPIKSTYTTSY